MLLYRMTKLVEDHARTKQGFVDPLGELEELVLLRDRMTSSIPGVMEEDCSDWGAEATY